MIHEKHARWLEAMGVSEELAEKFGLQTVAKDGGNWLAVPFVENGKTINHKYRLISEGHQHLDQGAPLVLWNHDCLLEESDRPVVVCAEEWHAMVAVSLGWRAVSVPNGAPQSASTDVANAQRYEFLWRARDHLSRAKEFILATGDDGPGIALRADLAALLGPERCRFVEYPSACNDLSQVVIVHGPEAVATALNGAKPYPVRGLYRFSDFPEVPPAKGLSVGIDCLDGKIEIIPGTLTVFTGYSNVGKSMVMNTVMAHAIANNVITCAASFETFPKPILQNGVARALLGCAQDEFDNHPDLAKAYAMVEERLAVISNSLDEELEFDIDTFLALAKVSILRDGVRFIVIDPWNELEHKRRRDETLTEYVGRAIRAVKRFARINNCAIWIVAHPTKPIKGTNTMPSLYDISDSAAWANKADYGLVYHRQDKTLNEAQIAVVKVRLGLPGHCCAELVKFDHRTGRICAYGA